jgi:two-component system, sensor histidine kinase ChiS
MNRIEKPSITGRKSLKKMAKQVIKERRRPCVLIVDDEEPTLSLLKELVEQHYRVNIAQSGMEALSSLSHFKIHTMLLDINMPLMSGFDVLDRMNELNIIQHIPVIILNSGIAPGDIERALEKGAIDYINKPVNKTELFSRIGTAIRIKLQGEKIQNVIHRIRYGYRRFIPFDLLKLLNKKSVARIDLGDYTERVMTIFFFDINNYSSPVYALPPLENIKLFNRYIQQMGPIIRQHYGFINTYIGNSIMALFPKSADDAVRAAIKVHEELKSLNNEFKKNIRIGIGIHTGRLIIGTVGEADRMYGTALSRTFNLVYRMENLTKKFNADIIISSETLIALNDPNSYHYRFLDVVKAEYSDNPVSVFEVLTVKEDDLEKRRTTLRDFESGIIHYQKKEFKKALGIFEKITEEDPDDYAVKIYIKRCKFYMKYKIREDIHESWL